METGPLFYFPVWQNIDSDFTVVEKKLFQIYKFNSHNNYNLTVLMLSVQQAFAVHITFFLAHLSQRLIGELIVYRSSRRLCVRASVRECVNTFKHEYLCNQLADWNEILSEVFLRW